MSSLRGLRYQFPFRCGALIKLPIGYGNLYGHGIEFMGLPRHRFVTVTLRRPVDALWVAEEALKLGAVAMVITDADAKHTSLTATRRLSLAAQAGRATGLMVFTTPQAGATASHTRWIASASRSQPPSYDHYAPGRPSWNLELVCARGGRPELGQRNGKMRRIVSIWFPNFAVERFTRARPKQSKAPPPAGLPFALVEGGPCGLRLIALNAMAKSFGLTQGQRLADARAQVPDLLSELHEPQDDMASLLGLRRWMERYSPWVSPDAADGILLDVTGTCKLQVTYLSNGA